MTIREFYGLDRDGYDGPVYPPDYFRCFDANGGSSVPDSKQAWLKHYWPACVLPLTGQELLARLIRVCRFGHAKNPGKRTAMINKLSLKEEDLATRSHEIHHALRLIQQGNIAPDISLRTLKSLKLPAFQQLSFGTKLLMFLNPGKFAVLDSKVADILYKMRTPHSAFGSAFGQDCLRIGDQIAATRRTKFTTIPISNHWAEIYSAWCAACSREATRWNAAAPSDAELWTASDIERVAFAA